VGSATMVPAEVELAELKMFSRMGTWLQFNPPDSESWSVSVAKVHQHRDTVASTDV
jgi:hypothetical protein